MARKLSWFVGLCVLLFTGNALYVIFRPAPSIVISKKTTVITAPLRADGLPDYGQYLMERFSEGVTPENNAAVLIRHASKLNLPLPESSPEGSE